MCPTQSHSGASEEIGTFAEASVPAAVAGKTDGGQIHADAIGTLQETHA